MIVKLVVTRGYVRFACIPLVIRLGDSRIRQGDSGYGVVLSIKTVTLTEHYSNLPQCSGDYFSDT